ncbi:MAG: SoxR reducing system RseC family protein [Gammaproteobacteria bacterium]
MIEVTTRVERANDRYIWLQRNTGSNCQRCQQGQGCGGAIWGRLISANSLLRLPNQLHAQPGNRLRLTISESRFLWMTAIAYLLPLLLIVIAAGLGHYWKDDLGALILSLFAGVSWITLLRTLITPISATTLLQGADQTLLP